MAYVIAEPCIGTKDTASKKVMQSMRRHAAVKGSLFCAELPCILEKRQGVWTIVQLRDALKNSAARLN
jgi:hypothetical protein